MRERTNRANNWKLSIVMCGVLIDDTIKKPALDRWMRLSSVLKITIYFPLSAPLPPLQVSSTTRRILGSFVIESEHHRSNIHEDWYLAESFYKSVASRINFQTSYFIWTRHLDQLVDLLSLSLSLGNVTLFVQKSNTCVRSRNEEPKRLLLFYHALVDVLFVY